MHDVSKPENISDNFAECLSEDSEGHIWAGTHAGLNRIGLRDSSFHCFSVTNGLASDWIAAVTFDQKQRVWVSTQKGISSIAADGKTIRNYDFNDGLPANAFLARSVATDRSGNLYFGSSRGLVWFHPDSIKDNHLMPVPVLVGFKVNDEPLVVSESSPLKQNIELAEEIRLDNEQSTFSIQMAALGYFNPQKNRIKYILKGHDRDWRLAGTDQTASYSGISPGTYTFSMVVSNEDGIWSTNEKSLKIVIARSAWLSGWAFLVYFLIFSGGIFYYWRKSKVVELSEPDFTKLKRTPNHDIIQPSQVVTEPADVQFLQKALLLVEENIADPNFGVEELCAGMCLSRPQLYRKINAIAGVTVTEFIKEVRLKRAAQLILQKPESISEVAYRVGFNDPKYFSKCFKQQFGVSPAHYPAPNERFLPPQ
jgi:AraC-like DNA-binding protein